MAVGAVVARILTQYSDKGSKAAQKDINKLGKNIDGFAKKATKAFGLAAAASGGAFEELAPGSNLRRREQGARNCVVPELRRGITKSKRFVHKDIHTLSSRTSLSLKFQNNF
jgi:hypothetical protein